jgi:hypothetical protein
MLFISLIQFLNLYILSFVDMLISYVRNERKLF